MPGRHIIIGENSPVIVSVENLKVESAKVIGLHYFGEKRPSKKEIW